MEPPDRTEDCSTNEAEEEYESVEFFDRRGLEKPKITRDCLIHSKECLVIPFSVTIPRSKMLAIHSHRSKRNPHQDGRHLPTTFVDHPTR